MSIASIKSNDVRLDDNCVICASTLNGGANEVQNDHDLMLVERCKHIFHRTCLQQHMQTPSDYASGVKTCPICRGNLSNVSVLHPNSSGDFETTGESVAAPFLAQDNSVLMDPFLLEADIELPLHLNLQQRLNNWIGRLSLVAAIIFRSPL